MLDQQGEAELVANAQAGERLAFERLLVRHQARLAIRIRQRIPARLQQVFDVDDILQETFFDGWEGIGRFQYGGEGTFFNWLARIADHRILDGVKAFRAAKRGGGRHQVVPERDDELTQLLSLLMMHERTPSRSVADREALHAVAAALPTLKQDYRDVLRLRFLEEASVAETARALNRTEWAVHKLTARALEALREAMGGVLQFLSRK